MQTRLRATALTILTLGSLTIAGLAGCARGNDAATTASEWAFDTTGFRTVLLRGNGGFPDFDGNSQEGIANALRKRYPAVEVDFHVTKDSVLVTSHDAELGGDCGTVVDRTWRELKGCSMPNGLHLATLEDVLASNFHETFLDLKNGYTVQELNDLAVDVAIAAVQAAGAERRTVLMLYRITPQIAAKLTAAGLRGGAKGFPTSDTEVRALIDVAAANGLEMMCSEARYLTPELVQYATSRGVWLLAWDLRGSGGVEHARALAAAGLGGMIARDVQLINAQVRPSSSLGGTR